MRLTLHLMVLPTLARELRQARKGATVAVTSVWWDHFFKRHSSRRTRAARPLLSTRGPRVEASQMPSMMAFSVALGRMAERAFSSEGRK